MRPATFHWEALGYQPHDLSSLEAPFSQDEIKDTIQSMPGDKAPGPDGFTGFFFKDCWEIIKPNLTAAFNQLYNMNVQGFELLNSANIFLLPKKMDAAKVGDYRPISLIHSIAKIFSKLLANILSSHLNTLVSKCGRTVRNNTPSEALVFHQTLSTPKASYIGRVSSSTPQGRTRIIHVFPPGSNNENEFTILSPFHTTRVLINILL